MQSHDIRRELDRLAEASSVVLRLVQQMRDHLALEESRLRRDDTPAAAKPPSDSIVNADVETG
jgi:hypothetical protein